MDAKTPINTMCFQGGVAHQGRAKRPEKCSFAGGDLCTLESTFAAALRNLS